MFTMLACRSDYSIGESVLSPWQLVKAAKEMGQSVVGLTDTMSATGLVDLFTAAKKEGIGALLGVRLRISPDVTWRPKKELGEKKKHMPKEHFLTLYVRSEAGLCAAFRLLTLAQQEPRFYYHAKLSWEDVRDEVAQLTAADYALLLGDEQSALQAPNFRQIVTDCIRLKLETYLPLVLIDTPYYGRVNKVAIQIHETCPSIPLLAVRPVLYEQGGADIQEIMSGVCENIPFSDGRFRSRYNRDLHPLGVKDFAAHAVGCAQHLVKRGVGNPGPLIKQAIDNTVPFASASTYQWVKKAPSLPKLADDEYAAVVHECREGFKRRFSTPMFGHMPTLDEQRDLYLPRLAMELDTLKRLGFSSYFLNVQEIVQFAKSSGIRVGPGRGSVGGSLVAYLMGITDIDPIRFGLLFERFINPERIDLPDADLDFMSTRRGEVIDHLIDRFGEDRVAGVTNFSTLGSASAIRDISRLAGIPESQYSVSKMVPKEHGQPVGLEKAAEEVAAIGEFAQQHDALWSLMLRLQGKIRSMSQHAAGVVVAGAPLTDFAALERRKNGFCVNWDKRVIEEQGLIKMDVLGLSTLDVIEHALRYIEEGTGRRIEIDQIPLDDPDTLRAFAEGRTTGVFQFEGGGMRGLLKSLGSLTGSVSFEDITAATALYRPGPMEAGMLDAFVKRKRGEELVEYIHPLTEEFTRETYGILVYQEQVMKTAQVVAGYTGAQADLLRKIMGKKLPDEMAKERDRFVQGCVDTVGADRVWAEALFSDIEGWAGYGFNKSHAAAYSLISYQCQYLKTHFPLEFYAANMTVADQDKLLAMMREAKEAGVTISYPDINKSSDRFEIVRSNREIVIPFQNIKGLSAKGAAAILKAREAGPFASKEDFENRVEKRSCNARVREALDKVGAFAGIEPGQLSATDPARIRDQKELLPGLVSDYVPIHRTMHHDAATKNAIVDLADEYRHALGPAGGGDGMPCKPHFGRSARIMIITDAPTAEEDGNGIMGYARSNTAVTDAMMDAGFDMGDVYWTGLLKRPKRQGRITSEEIGLYKPYLMREIEILKPTVIITMGSSISREFVPALRGKVSDMAGDVLYFSDLDANVVLGFSPGEIWHSPEKQDNMNRIFQVVRDLV